MSSTIMVGRRAELATLQAAWAEGRQGIPRAVVVRGEAGIGKTRLLQEFLTTVESESTDPPVVVAVGQCVDLGPIGAPFTPIRRLLLDLYRGVGDESFRLAAGSETVQHTLAALVPELPQGSTPAPSGSDYVAEAVERIIEGLSQTHHLVLVVEDLHWADAASLALLKTLAVTLRGRHVTMICTYRAEDVGRGHPLRAVLSELDRSRLVTGLEISRLSAPEIVELSEHLTGTRRTDVEVEAVVARSQGVPFFVEELLQLQGRALPATLRDVVLARFERLPPPTRDVVALVAVGGVQVDDDLVAQTYRGDSSALREGLRDSVTEGVLVADDVGYTFRHALIQEAVHDQLLPMERVELHARYAQALQRRVDGGDLAVAAVTAEHWLAAKDLPRAFVATMAARTHARSGNARASVARLGDRLLELWAQVPQAQEFLGKSSAELSLEVSEDFHSLGEFDRCWRVAQIGLQQVGADEPMVQVALLHEVATRGRTVGDGAAVEELMTQALALLDNPSTPEEQAWHAQSEAIRIFNGQPVEQAEEILDAAVEMATLSGDPSALAVTLEIRGSYASDRGDPLTYLDYLNRAADLPVDRWRHFVMITNIVDTLLNLGRYREAIALGKAAAVEATAEGLERGSASMLYANVAECELSLGEVESGRARALRCLALTNHYPAFHSFSLRLLAQSFFWDDNNDQYDDLNRRGLEVMVDLDDLEEIAGWILIHLDRVLGDHREGVAVDLGPIMKRCLEQLRADRPGPSSRLLPSVARLAVAAGPAGGAALRREVRRVVAALPDSPQIPYLKANVDAELEGGTARWRQVLSHAESGLMPVRHVHEARLHLAEALVAEGERDEAVELLQQVVDLAPGHGASLLARWARELASRAGLSLKTAETEAPRDQPPGLQTLTKRELQVLGLVAEGLTNPQIGKQLFISPKTASVHVSAILAKIGAANRAEAAALFSSLQGHLTS